MQKPEGIKAYRSFSTTVAKTPSRIRVMRVKVTTTITTTE